MLRISAAALNWSTGYIASGCDTLIALLRLSLRGAQIGKHFKVRGALDLYIQRKAVVRIGDNCRIKSGFAENPVGGYRRTGIWVGRHATLSIGQRVGVSSSTIVCSHSVTIEDDVLIGGGCNIYDTDFHSLLADARLVRPDVTVKTAPVVIKRRSFVGAHSIILKGVVIGEEAVIGAGSVVRSNVPAGEIWAGNPACFVRKVL